MLLYTHIYTSRAASQPICQSEFVDRGQWRQEDMMGKEAIHSVTQSVGGGEFTAEEEDVLINIFAKHISIYEISHVNL